MIKLSLKREKFELYVDDAVDLSGLEELTKMRFSTLTDVQSNIRRYNSYVATDLIAINSFINPGITELPFTLKELPVFYCDTKAHYGNGMYIGNVEVVD